MTAAEWLSSRKPVPPPELSRAIRSAVAAAPERSDVPAELVAASAALAERVAGDECGDRSHALDLLAFDSLLTYAMEASLGSAEKCEATAAALLSVIGGRAEK